jgi:hypothetical protein
MSASHTPGPWSACNLKGGGFEIHDMPECHESTVLCARNPHSKKVQEFHANAILIAAAPELLEALDKLICIVGLTAFKHEAQLAVLQEAVDSARAVIAKAVKS